MQVRGRRGTWPRCSVRYGLALSRGLRPAQAFCSSPLRAVVGPLLLNLLPLAASSGPSSAPGLDRLSFLLPPALRPGSPQIVMTSGKEGVLSEKTMSVHFGRTLVVQYSRVGTAVRRGRRAGGLRFGVTGKQPRLAPGCGRGTQGANTGWRAVGYSYRPHWVRPRSQGAVRTSCVSATGCGLPSVPLDAVHAGRGAGTIRLQLMDAHGPMPCTVVRAPQHSSWHRCVVAIPLAPPGAQAEDYNVAFGPSIKWPHSTRIHVSCSV